MSQLAAEPREEVPITHYFGRGLTLDLGQTRQDALLAIINIFAECRKNPKKVNVVTVLAQISKYFGKSLDQNQAGKLELIVGNHDWQLWTKYKKALSDFQSGYARDLKTKIMESYELHNRLTANDPYLLVDDDYSRLANYIDGSSPQPPIGVDLQYWYSITPHIFTVSEARRAIDKVNQLHQEYQWATHGEGGWANKGLWLFVWRVLKKMWLNQHRDVQNFHVTIAAAVSQLEKPFLDEHTAIFNRMHRTSEILHFSDAQKLVLDFALRCYRTFSASQQEQFAKSANLANSSKECLHAFLHGEMDLTVKVINVLRHTAARYYAQHLEELKQLDEHGVVMQVDEEPVNEDFDESQHNVHPVPIALARKSAYDYVWYDMPDTRPREVAESRRIERDMTDPGIQSDGLRVSDLVNLPPRHARLPGHVSRWNRFSPLIGPISATWRLARYFLKGSKLIRTEPLISKRLPRRQLVKREPNLPGTALLPVRDNARRVSKSGTPIRLPTVKLRGGGPMPSPGWQRNWSREQGRLVAELAKRVGIEQLTTDQANFLVGSYLSAAEWNVKTAEGLWKEKAIPPEDMHYDIQRIKEVDNPQIAGLSESRRGQIKLLMAALDQAQSVAVTDDAILAALEVHDWRWEAALTDIRAGHRPEASQAQPSLGGGALPSSTTVDQESRLSERSKGPPITPNRLYANEYPKRPIHIGSKGYATDNRASDDQSSEILEVPPKRSSSPAREASARKLVRERQLEQQHGIEAGTGENFEIYDENGGSPARSGLEDPIDEFEDNSGHVSSLPGGCIDKDKSGPLDEMDVELELCHPCPRYDGQYHHICNEHGCKYGAMGADAEALRHSQGPRNPGELPFETGSLPSAQNSQFTVLDRDIREVTSRESQGATLNEVKLHARLQRIVRVASVWQSGIQPCPVLGGTILWQDFRLPEPIEPNGTLSYESFRQCYGEWHSASSPGAKQATLKTIHEYILDLVKAHYDRNITPRVTNSSDAAVKVETFRTRPYYYRQTQRLKRDLHGLADLFAEVDGFSGMEYRRKSHAEHHDFFRGAYSGLLSLRRGLGQVVPDAECDDVPRWSDYRGQGQAPNQELHAAVRMAEAAVDALSAFFWTGDPETDIDQSVAYLWETICNVRGVLYSSHDRITPPVQRRQATPDGLLKRGENGQRKSPSQPRTGTKSKRKVIGVDDEAEDGARAASAKKQRVAATKATSAPKGGSSTRSASLGPSDKENQPVIESIEKDEVEEEEESDDSDEVEDDNEEDEIEEDEADRPAEQRALKPISVRKSSGSKAKTAPKPKAAPKSKQGQNAEPAREVPSSHDYSSIMYLDEIQQEIKYRGVRVKGKAVKANLVHHLVNADKAGNTGLGVMRSWRKMNGKQGNDGSRPAKYKLPSVAEVKKRFGDRLI